MDIQSRIQEYADKLGASRDAQRKWRERGGVPPKWQLEIIRASGGTITANDFLQIGEGAQ